MAPIVEEMERRVKEEGGRVDVQFLSYVDDLHRGLYDRRVAGEEEAKRERMQDLVARVQRVVNEVAAERELPLAADKEESMVLRGGCGRKKRRKNGFPEKVKWLGVILDNRLDFREHWRHRIGKARSLLRAFCGVGNSRWGMNPVSWRAAYTGMIRAVASWGVEIGWRGQKKWRHEMTLLQDAAMRKTVGAVKGSSGRKAGAIAAVEDVETFVRAATGRFLTRTLCDPPRAGIGVVDEGIAGKGQLACGGECWRGHVEVVDLGPCKSSTPEVWERAIKEAGGEKLVVYTDGSGDNDGRVGGGWHGAGNGAGSVAVGTIATVWDGEVAGIRQALRMASEVDLLVLLDSTAALQAIVRAAHNGRGRTRDLVEVVDEVGRRGLLGLSTQFGWVKAHAGIGGNERADLMAKAGCRESLLPQVTEGGVRAYWKGIRSGERAQRGLGSGRLVRWDRRAVLRYTHMRVGKGDVGEWRRVIGNEGTQYRLCGVEEETGTHLVFGCEESYGLRPWNWASWEEMDDKEKWQYTVEGEGGKLMVLDKVEDFFVALDRALVGVG